ncbi:uncharacterized protein LOC134310012 isoform X2 [Trichomycterus rosablanca]|uniref:uncharacterized protein LOC134310012 isoform X2 n=1 Tax=Trichomycterus rosablanca TaxID=2290929 RepID=UPI002F35298F
MPKSQCKTCGETLPLQVLALHVQTCSKSSEDSDQEQEENMSPDVRFGACVQNMCHACVTRLFDGEPDHLVPSSSAFLVESDLFLMAGRMIGHCFLHGGPALSGLSPAVIHLLSGGKAETAVVEICDCPDLDLRERIKLLEGNSELSASEKDSVDSLCFSWDLPAVTISNRRWLFERLLHHAVIGRTMKQIKQIKQIRKGLKETLLWPLMTHRPDVLPVIFPRESNAVLTPESILNCISWPTMIVDDDDDDCSVEDKSRVTGYLCQFIENASSDELKALLKFWVGWEAPTSTLKVEVVESHQLVLRLYVFQPTTRTLQSSRKNCKHASTQLTLDLDC